MLRLMRRPLLVFAVAGWFMTYSSAPALAGLVPSEPIGQEVKSQREMELQKIQRALENRLVQEKLQAYGLTKEEVQKRLSELSDEEVHMLAKASDRVLAGGDGLGVVIAVLVILILVVILLKLLNKEIIIR